MESISDFVKLYIEDSSILDEKATEIKHELSPAIKENLYKKHGYDTGTLYRDISTSKTVHKNFAVVTGYYTVEHGQYWYRWKNWKENTGFLGLGVEKILRLYK